MEIHHHTHTARKKWTHYFWEFFMLFLAVFCGFLAENQREHFVEHQREKKFMQLLAEDLETDTTELLKAIRKAKDVVRYSDSVLIFLKSYPISKFVPVRFATYVGNAGQRQTLINTDRTSSQLKNAGGMRLVRNNKVSNLILRYWKQIDETNISLERYLVYRDRGRELVFGLWIIPEVYRSGFLLKPEEIQLLRVIDRDSKKWDEFSNYIAISSSITQNTHSKNLEQQLQLARELIVLIKKEYSLH